jgi:hypothetical protein
LTATVTSFAGDDSMLYLFDSPGAGILANDDRGQGQVWSIITGMLLCGGAWLLTRRRASAAPCERVDATAVWAIGRRLLRETISPLIAVNASDFGRLSRKGNPLVRRP